MQTAARAPRSHVTRAGTMIEQEVALDEAPLTLLREGGENDSKSMRAKVRAVQQLDFKSKCNNLTSSRPRVESMLDFPTA